MNTNNTTLLACASLTALTFNDIYLIIVGVSILVSTIIAVINAIKQGKNITIDPNTKKQLEDIDNELNKEHEDSTNKQSPLIIIFE